MHSCRSRKGRWGFGTLLGSVLMLVPAPLAGVDAAAGFATSAFQVQWVAGEAITPNCWGPLATAREGQTEADQEGALDCSESGPTNPGQGTRRVQYFIGLTQLSAEARNE